MTDIVAGGLSAAPAQFRVGTVMNKTFAILGHQFWKFTLLTLLPMAPLLILTLVSASSSGTSGAAVTSAGTGFLTIALQSLAQATSLYGAFQIMRGQSFTIRESFQIALARAVPVIGVSILCALATILGMVLFIVPGIILGCMLYVAIPACVIEKSGVMASLKRSVALTKGYRWQIFGLFLLVMVVGTVAGLVLVKVGEENIVGQLLGFAAQVISTTFGAVLSAVIYHDLRAAKEGIDLDTLANVFD